MLGRVGPVTSTNKETIMTTTLGYRARLCIQLFNESDSTKTASPFKTISLADYWIDADLIMHVHETDTDQGVLEEESVEVEDVRVISSDLLMENARFVNDVHHAARLRGFLKSEVWDSAERAIEKSETSDPDEVVMEYDA